MTKYGLSEIHLLQSKLDGLQLKKLTNNMAKETIENIDFSLGYDAVKSRLMRLNKKDLVGLVGHFMDMSEKLEQEDQESDNTVATHESYISFLIALVIVMGMTIGGLILAMLGII